MTKLEEEIMEAMARAPKVPVYDVFNSVREFQEEMTLNARAAAEVAKNYIEKALDYNVLLKTFDATPHEIKSKWLKENGIIENQPTDKAPGPLKEPAGDNIKEL